MKDRHFSFFLATSLSLIFVRTVISPHTSCLSHDGVEFFTEAAQWRG